MNGNDGWNQVITTVFNTVYLFYLYHTIINSAQILIHVKCSFDVQHAELYKLDEHALSDSWYTQQSKLEKNMMRPNNLYLRSLLVGFPT